MYERSFWDSFDGHAGERLATFAPHFPLICLALTPIMISTFMTNRVFTSFRCSFGVPTATKWMTLKWRVILLTVALITLTFYNVRCWDSVNLFENSLYDRFSASLQLENPDGFLSFIFYLLIF